MTTTVDHAVTGLFRDLSAAYFELASLDALAIERILTKWHLDAQMSVRAIVWRMRGEIQQLATYPQARPRMTAVCKTVG